MKNLFITACFDKKIKKMRPEEKPKDKPKGKSNGDKHVNPR